MKKLKKKLYKSALIVLPAATMLIVAFINIHM